MILQIADHIIVGGNRVVAKEFAQTDQRLHPRKTCGRDVGLKLEKLKFDLQVVAFTNVSSFQLCFADINRLLKALQVLQRKLERRFRQQYTDELLADIERERALGVGNLGASDGSRIARSLQTPPPLVTPLKEV